MNYHTLTAEEVVAHLNGSLNGLSAAEAMDRRMKYGLNALQEKKRTSAFVLFLLQFKDFMILVLALAAVLAIFLGDLTDSIIILLILFINATIGFILEYRAGKSMEALRKLSEVSTRVYRDGQNIMGILRGENIFQLVLLSMSLAVAAIPESLPALITVALAGGSVRLARKKALIKKLPAVESLGSVTYICSDKTGTLTQNKMHVVKEYAVQGLPVTGAWPFFHFVVAMNQDVLVDKKGKLSGEPTELALTEHIIKEHPDLDLNRLLTKFPRVAELPFDADRKRMSTMHATEGNKFIMITKGASESIELALKDTADKEKLKALSEAWATTGIRVLAYAYKYLDAVPEVPEAINLENDMLLAGIVGMVDPARKEVKKAISECREAGIKTVMITGDHPATAAYIAREIGILDETSLVLSGAELVGMSKEDFLEQVEKTLVYARVSPEQKLQIIRHLQQKGHFVAMTGDGVNDAPSLKAANIGIAMGITGTDVSKEAAHLILLDDNFTTIVKAVKEGRRIFDNIRKFVKYVLTCNSAELLTILIAPLLGMPIPLLPIHILWINLVTDGLPALALAREKAENDSMRRPPFPANESLFSRGAGFHIVWVGVLMAVVTMATQAWAIQREAAYWQTMVFTVLALSQLGHVLAIRSNKIPLYKQGLLSNLTLTGAVLLTFLLQMAVVYLPFMNRLLKTQALPLTDLLICVALSLVVFHAVELEKWIKRRYFPALAY